MNKLLYQLRRPLPAVYLVAALALATSAIASFVKQVSAGANEDHPAVTAPLDETAATLSGVAVTDLNQQTRQQFNVPRDIKGAVIMDVQPDSAAADVGLKAGNVIEEINRDPVKNAEDAIRLTENAKDRHTLLRVWSDGGSHYLVVDESQNAG